MKRAKIEIIFCNQISETEYYEVFKINEQSFFIKQGKVEAAIGFNDLEEEIGKKVCKCELIKKTKESTITYSGLIEIFLNTINRAYCFIQKSKGMTLELCFYSPKDKIDCFINNKFNISTENKDFSIAPNSMGTERQANIILINIPIDYSITINDKNSKKEEIKISTLFKSIDNFDFDYNNSYKICFFVDKLKEFVYRKIKYLDELNFGKIYDKYNNDVESIYKAIIEVINKNNNIIDEYQNIFNINIPIDDLLNKKKYIFPKKILKKEIDKDNYIDFIFKVIFIVLVKENFDKVQAEISREDLNENEKKDLEEEISPKYLYGIHQKLLENKNKICKDKKLEIYEKLFILIYIYHTKKLFDKDYIIKYLNVKDTEEVEKGSPLNLAFKFCEEFADSLDYDSNFFYALLCIDGGMYKYKYKKEEEKDISYNIKTFGFDMYTLDTIRHHLKDMIPNFIIISDDKEYEADEETEEEEDAEANTDVGLGITKLLIKNLRKYGNIEYTKKNKEKRVNTKYGFILSKIILHELFTHKKGSFSKIGLHFDSPWSFKDKEGEIRFVSQYFTNDQFKNIDLIQINDEFLKNIDGESGFFFEFFFGKIFNKYTVELMDRLIMEKEDLSALFDTSLWHKNIDVLNEYVKLKYFIKKKYKRDFVLNEALDIYEQIKEMQSIISKNENSVDIDEPIKKFFLSDEVDENLNGKLFMKNEPKNNIQKYKINRYYANLSYTNNNGGINVNRLLREALSPNTSLREYQKLYPLIKSRLFKK